jgi:NADPH-dependent glutamate synthase beta subunit-like oxidoreductase/NAD(P)H-flavin reductase
LAATRELRPGEAELTLAFGLGFDDLYARDGLVRLDGVFLSAVREADAALAARLEAARADPVALEPKAESALLLDLAPHLEGFIARLFGIQKEAAALTGRHDELAPLYAVKRKFVQRHAVSKFKPPQALEIDGLAVEAELRRLFGGEFSELVFAQHVAAWQADEAASATHAAQLDLATRYAAWALQTPAGQEHTRSGILFKAPAKTDPMHLLHHAQEQREDGVNRFTIRPEHIRRREGFALTDPGTDLVGALDQANYCIWCHMQGKDSCSKGLKEKPNAEGKVLFKKSAFGVTLAGCPLEEKISEFHMAKTQGLAMAALAIITVDNPMVAATGHRICNDCMKACIYQKQEPVNIPEAETRTLKDVLELPWGFEIYSLLTRWNPLNIRRPYPAESTGKKVLVVGLGPAGFTLSHYLLNEGHTIAAVDGLKIEPLPPELSGVQDGRHVPFQPVRDVNSLYEQLGERVMAGFGGVAEYGITVRWNKNFLKVIRLLLERRTDFALYGGVRFGGTLGVEDAQALGFDHIALCMGAGKPTVLDIPNGLARGVRTASDFLMALQLTGAAKPDSLASMQLRLPVVVIGGGLTAIDTATESLAYYVVQVEKFLNRYEALVSDSDEDTVRARWSDEEREVAEEFLAHARAIRAERQKAVAEKRQPHIIELLQEWGGVTIAYRRRLIDSPSYTLNHEEVEKALEEGIAFEEGLTPAGIDLDDYGAVSSIRFRRQPSGAVGTSDETAEYILPAHTVFVAAGTQPNTVLAREDAAHFSLDGKYFRACDEQGQAVKPQFSLSKPEQAEVLLSRLDDGRFISFFGDLHPSYFGNVVKAMGSARQGYPVVSRVLARRQAANPAASAEFFAGLGDRLLARVERVERLTPTIVEVVVRAPLAAEKFQPGQFYRLQNYETSSPLLEHDGHATRMQMEGLALTGAWVDRDKGLVSVIVLEMGGSSDLCAMLKPGERVILMGPTGTPTHIQANETALLVGGGLGNAVLFSIGQAFRAAGSKVLYFAGYKKVIDRYKVAEIEAAADVIVWCCDELPGFRPGRPQDRTFVGNIVQAMEAYAAGRLGEQTIRMLDADRIIAIGSDRMMSAVGRARHDVLRAHLKPHHFAIGSINSPMQCMMKEICAQCLQPQRDPQTGKVSYVFSCFNQDQPLDAVDFHALSERLRQNSLQEKLAAQWIRQNREDLKAQRTLV